MAHWALLEIVSNIAANLVSDDARASAVILASCSKSLEDPALGEVWRSLSSIEPLIRCFPPEVWQVKDEKLSFKRAPLRAEWTRFQQQYASKVKHLEVSSPHETVEWASLHLLQQLSHCGPVLPNLVSLNWDSDETFLPFVPPFISRSLASIAIDVPREATPMFPPIFTRLSTISTCVRDIQIELLSQDPSTKEASSQLIMQCHPNHLRKYNVDTPISASAFKHIMQLPSLEEFWLIVDSFQLPDPLPIVVFPSLRRLVVEHNGDPTWLGLLPAIESPVLADISIQCLESDIAQFMETFQLAMTGCGIHERLREFVLCYKFWNDSFKISRQVVACILSFNNLISLKVISKCSTPICQTHDLTDGDIDLLTKAMPRLEALAIGEEPCCVPSQITFKSLYTISHRCTRLKNLQIHFNPTLFITKVKESGHVALGLSDFPLSSKLCSVTMINVGNIPLPQGYNKASILALGLVGLFPCLERLEYKSYGWNNVDDLIHYCRRMGSFTFGNLALLGPS